MPKQLGRTSVPKSEEGQGHPNCASLPKRLRGKVPKQLALGPPPALEQACRPYLCPPLSPLNLWAPLFLLICLALLYPLSFGHVRSP